MQPIQPVTLLLPEIKELLKEKDYVLLKQVLKECNPIGFSDSWHLLSEEDRLIIFELLSATSALKLFKVLDSEYQKSILDKLSDENVTPLLTGIDSPDMASLLNRMPPGIVAKMRSFFRRSDALARVDIVMQFPKNSAGSLMHPEFIKLGPRLTAKQALIRLQAVIRPRTKIHLFALYVTDDQGKVIGAVDLYDLLASSGDEKLSELMASVEGIKVRPETDQEEVSRLFSKYHLNSVPVIDEGGHLLGILTVKDIMAVVHQEATEDMAKMVGTQYLDVKESSVIKTVRYRMPWLVVTLFGELLVSFIIKSFEPVLSRVIALAAFSPLISAMGGNVGSQSATIVVRSLALGHLSDMPKKVRTILHETKVGLILGLSYGAFLATIAYLLYGNQYHWPFSLAVFIGMFTSITVAATMGAVEPIFFHRIGIDPATATGPLITTITDIFTNFTYYALATVLLLHTDKITRILHSFLSLIRR